MSAPATIETCYRHPSRETGVKCSNCGRPICPDCMTPTPVGMRCPECSKQTTPVRNLASTRPSAGQVTLTLIAVNVLIFLASGSFGFSGTSATNTLYREGVLFGPFIADGDWWRLASYGFLHSGLLHIGFNMYLLYLLGTELERDLGAVKFALLYLAGLLGGAAGALLLDFNAGTVGASGAVFGLMGYAFFDLRARGINPMQTTIGPLLLLNLVIGFIIPNVSVGGHLGGLAAGALASVALVAVDRNRRLPRWAGLAVLVVVCVGALAAGLLVAENGTPAF